MGAAWYERNRDYQKANAQKLRDEYRQTGREFLWDYLSTHPCIECGESNPHALEFHYAHHNPMNTVVVDTLENAISQ